MSMSLHVTLGGRTERFALSVRDIADLAARATGNLRAPIDRLMAGGMPSSETRTRSTPANCGRRWPRS